MSPPDALCLCFCIVEKEKNMPGSVWSYVTTDQQLHQRVSWPCVWNCQVNSQLHSIHCSVPRISPASLITCSYKRALDSVNVQSDDNDKLATMNTMWQSKTRPLCGVVKPVLVEDLNWRAEQQSNILKPRTGRNVTPNNFLWLSVHQI